MKFQDVILTFKNPPLYHATIITKTSQICTYGISIPLLASGNDHEQAFQKNQSLDDSSTSNLNKIRKVFRLN